MLSHTRAKRSGHGKKTSFSRGLFSTFNFVEPLLNARLTTRFRSPKNPVQTSTQQCSFGNRMTPKCRFSTPESREGVRWTHRNCPVTCTRIVRYWRATRALTNFPNRQLVKERFVRNARQPRHRTNSLPTTKTKRTLPRRQPHFRENLGILAGLIESGRARFVAWQTSLAC
jgi:hypothetical protein